MIDAGPCSRNVEDIQVTFDLAPKPVRAMRELEFTVLLAKDSDPVAGASIIVDLTMPGMDMGENKVRLAPRSSGKYTGKGVIVRCPSGRTLWKAAVIITREEHAVTADFFFEVK
jgi:nitrogen fixation protein FixH